MTTLQPFPKFTAFDANGNPLSGGLVYSYAAGTTTPLDTYTDSTTDSPNFNPVVLNAAGQADIWYGDAMYKIELRDANGVLQWTVDNIGTTTAATMSNGGFGQATDIASASLVNLGTVTSHFANITGSVQIDAFGSTATIDAPIYLIKFESALTLTNSANLFLPTGEDIVTAQNDRALVEYLGSGAWRVFSYMRANGTPLLVDTINEDISFTGIITPTTLAANTDNWAPTDLATSSVVRVSASAAYNLTGIAGGTSGRTIFLENVGSFPITLINDATSTAANRFYCPGSLSFVLNPNASTILQYDDTSSRWRVISANTTRAGQVIQSVVTSTTASSTVTNVIPFDNTKPQASEGVDVVTVSITPTSTTSILRITGQLNGFSGNSGSQMVAMIFKNTDVDALAVTVSGAFNVGVGFQVPIFYSVAAGALTSITFKLKVGVNTGTLYINQGNAAALFDGTMNSWIKVEEIAV